MITPLKFAISTRSRNDHEAGTVVAHCIRNDLTYRMFAKPEDVPSDFVPVGTVDWVEKVLGYNDEPNYYPSFLAAHLHRKIWRADKWPYGSRVFIKPSDRHKRFTGFVTTGTWKGKKKGPFWCAEIVQFVTEWRWYVANEKVLTARYGSGEEAPVPDLQIDWPADYCGAVDFGRLTDGRLALIEANSPFSCGWYGSMSEGKVYVEWLAAGWEHMKKRAGQVV